MAQESRLIEKNESTTDVQSSASSQIFDGVGFLMLERSNLFIRIFFPKKARLSSISYDRSSFPYSSRRMRKLLGII